MIKVLVNGCNGKMGQVVINQLENFDDMILFGGFDIENTGKYTFPIFTKFEDIIEKPDVIIDFTVPVATMNMLKYASQNKIPVVIATTGFNAEQEEKIQEYSKIIPIFKSANMSFDICLMTKILKIIAEKLQGCDIEISETHHNRKVDSPSGTALLLANAINSVFDNSMSYEFDRHSKREKRSKNEIGFSSIRGGNIVGEHSVYFFGENETLEIKHTSYSRSIFADGSIKAANFLVNQPNGLYNMEDLA